MNLMYFFWEGMSVCVCTRSWLALEPPLDDRLVESSREIICILEGSFYSCLCFVYTSIMSDELLLT